MRFTRRPSLDANHASIVSDSKRYGLSVYDGATVGGGASDLIMANRSKLTIVFEVKNGDVQSYFYLRQLEFLANWKGHSAIVKTFDDVCNAFSKPDKYCLSDRQKGRLLEFVELEKFRVALSPSKLAKHKVYTKRIEDILGEKALCPASE